METPNHIKALAFKYGSYYAFLYILILVLEESFNLQNQVMISIGGIVLSFLIVWQATNEFKSLGDGIMGISEGIKIGLAIGVIGGIGYAIFMYVNYSFVNTELIETIREQALNELQSQSDSGQLKTDEEVEMAKKGMLMFTSPFALATIALIGQVIKTFIFGLIIGLINRSKNS